MIIPKQEEQELLQSDFDSAGFEIDKSDLAIVFSTISEGLYSDPLSSIVREITSNAIDATIEAGKDDPVIVKLDQDSGGPYLSIQDFGVGLSVERIESVYKKLFKSTKRERNDQIGAFGLGRFSIFSYTNTFYLTTVFEGIEYGYQLYLQDGIPNMVDLYNKPTTAPNGTTVKIYLQHKDVEKAREKIKDTLMYFSNVYVIDNISGGKKYNNEYKLVQGKTFIHSTNSEHKELHISLGGVYYPINWSALGYKSKIEMNCALKFNNGDLTVTRSREEIKYTDATIAKILAAISEFQSEVVDLYRKKERNLKDFKTYEDFKQIGNKDYDMIVDGVSITVDFSRVGVSLSNYYYDDGIIWIDTKHEIQHILAAIGGRAHYINRTTLSTNEVDILNYGFYINKVCYKFSHEPLTKKAIGIANAQGYTKIIILGKKLDNGRTSVNYLAGMYAGKTATNKPQAAREVIQHFIGLLSKMKDIHKIKHISEFKEEKVNVVKNLTFRACVSSSGYVPLAKLDLTKNRGIILHNIALKKEEFLCQIFPKSIVAKGTKKDLAASGLPYKTMEEVVKMSKMHDLLRAYKLSKTYSGVSNRYLQSGLVKNNTLESLLQPTGKVNGLKIAQNDLLDEMLATYEESHPIDVTTHETLLTNFSKFDRIADVILKTGLSITDKLLSVRSLCISLNLQYAHWLGNTKFIEALEYVINQYGVLSYTDRELLKGLHENLHTLLDGFRYTNSVIYAEFNISDELIAQVIDLASKKDEINPLKTLLQEELDKNKPTF